MLFALRFRALPATLWWSLERTGGHKRVLLPLALEKQGRTNPCGGCVVGPLVDTSSPDRGPCGNGFLSIVWLWNRWLTEDLGTKETKFPFQHASLSWWDFKLLYSHCLTLDLRILGHEHNINFWLIDLILHFYHLAWLRQTLTPSVGNQLDVPSAVPSHLEW
jgi:hypothetical protein